MYLLDTNVLSKLVRMRPNAGVTARIRELAYQDTYASIVTLFELRCGAMRREDATEFWTRIQRQIVEVQDGMALKLCVAREYLQARLLQSLQESGVFMRWAFLGGTALRFLYSLPRYSEDLDFSLVEGVREAGFRMALENVKHVFEAENVTLNLQHYDKASLLAGKLHAVLSRTYSKGRDLYDLVWYLSDRSWPGPNLVLLNAALGQTGWKGAALTPENWRSSVIVFLHETGCTSYESANVSTAKSRSTAH